jgi:uncharacterized protein
MDDFTFPHELPVFPLTGALLLPGGQLPLNIFEPRYLTMIDAALGAGRWLGMVQPRDTRAQTVGDDHALFEIGCLGRIASFSESADGRYLISLNGVCRFTILSELGLRDGYRSVVPDFQPFNNDLETESLEPEERKTLNDALRRYFHDNSYEADWQALEQTADDTLVASMAMACPFTPAEKQALLESPDLAARARSLVAVLNMAAHGATSNLDQPRH